MKSRTGRPVLMTKGACHAARLPVRARGAAGGDQTGGEPAEAKSRRRDESVCMRASFFFFLADYSPYLQPAVRPVRPCLLVLSCISDRQAQGRRRVLGPTTRNRWNVDRSAGRCGKTIWLSVRGEGRACDVLLACLLAARAGAVEEAKRLCWSEGWQLRLIRAVRLSSLSRWGRRWRGALVFFRLCSCIQCVSSGTQHHGDRHTCETLRLRRVREEEKSRFRWQGTGCFLPLCSSTFPCRVPANEALSGGVLVVAGSGVVLAETSRWRRTGQCGLAAARHCPPGPQGWHGRDAPVLGAQVLRCLPGGQAPGR